VGEGTGGLVGKCAFAGYGGCGAWFVRGACRRGLVGAGFAREWGGLVGAGFAAFLKVAFDRLFAFFLLGLFFLAEGFLDGAVALFIIEFAEIVGFAFAQAGTLSGGGVLLHLS